MDQWSRLCSVQGTPFAQPSKISDEFKKRINREGTAEAKEKLSFHGCDLTDAQVSFPATLYFDRLIQTFQVIAFSHVIAENPKIAYLDLTENDAINEAGVKAMNHLIMCQLEASKILANDPALNCVTFINEIKWSKKQQRFVPSDILQVRKIEIFQNKVFPDLSLCS